MTDARPEVDPRKVFVIHGRNEPARKGLFAFLRAIGLEPIEWSEAITMTGQGSPYIGDVLNVAFGAARLWSCSRPRTTWRTFMSR